MIPQNCLVSSSKAPSLFLLFFSLLAKKKKATFFLVNYSFAPLTLYISTNSFAPLNKIEIHSNGRN